MFKCRSQPIYGRDENKTSLETEIVKTLVPKAY